MRTLDISRPYRSKCADWISQLVRNVSVPMHLDL